MAQTFGVCAIFVRILTSRAKGAREMGYPYSRFGPAYRDLLRGLEEVVVGGVGAFGFGVFVLSVAAVRGRLAAVRVDALNHVHVAEQAFSVVAYDVDQEPGDGSGIERVDVGGGLAGNFAAVFQLPGGPGGVLADDFVFAIFEFGVGRFEGPGKLAVGAGLAGVDLRSGGVREQGNFLAGGKLDGIGHVGRGVFLRGVLSRGGGENQEREEKSVGLHSAIVAAGF